MPSYRFLFVTESGGFLDVEQMKDGDRVLNHVTEDDFTAANSFLHSDTTGTVVSKPVNQNEMVGRISSGELGGMDPSEVRAFANVEDDSQNNAAANAGESTGVGIYGTFYQKDPVGTALQMRSIGPLDLNDDVDGGRRLKSTLSTNRILLDPMELPLHWSIEGNARIVTSTLFPIMKMEQQLEIMQLDCLVTSDDTTAPTLEFRIYKNNRRVIDGNETEVINFIGGNSLTDQVGAGDGYVHRDDGGQTHIITAGGANIISAGNWLFCVISSKTGTVDGFDIMIRFSFEYN